VRRVLHLGDETIVVPEALPLVDHRAQFERRLLVGNRCGHLAGDEARGGELLNQLGE